MSDVADDYVEAVLDLVARIPRGRATTYGVIAEAAREVTGRGSARTVGRVMANHGSDVPWWRVVTASGAAAERVAGRALALLRQEGVPLTDHDPPRVDLHAAGWEPGEVVAADPAGREGADDHPDHEAQM